MFKNLFRNYIYPVATLSGSIIGVGFLSLPYIALKVGIWPMLFYLAALTILMICVHVIFGQIVLKTPDLKMFPGIIGFHLGKGFEVFTLALMILGSWGVLLAYVIIGGQFLTTLLSPFWGGNALLYTVAYLVALSVIIYVGIKAISKLEFWALVLLFVCFAVVFIMGGSHMTWENMFPGAMVGAGDWKTLFLPYGALMFSLWGTGLIPQTEEMLGGNKKLLKRVVIISTLIPALVYFLFILLILGISGPQTTESALPGLKLFLSQAAFFVAIFIGLLTTFTAFIAQGLLLKKTFIYDMGVSPLGAWMLTCFVPLALFLLGFTAFIPIISFIGGFLLSVDGILILLVYKKIGGKGKIMYPLAVVFLLGIVYQIVYFIQ